MNEASKTRALWGELELTIIAGRGIDIGCGDDPISPTARRFDKEDGDANDIASFVTGTFDFVFSSHCLEHVNDVPSALKGWWSLVRPGGHLILVVPDEDLYEQGYWPSLFNGDHKHTFTIGKRQSWSPCSHNLLDLAGRLEGAQVIKLELQDNGYRRNLLRHAAYPRWLAKLGTRTRNILVTLAGRLGIDARLYAPFALLGFPVDQTQNGAVAQVQMVLRKLEPASTRVR